jgi:hypothetical protein
MLKELHPLSQPLYLPHQLQQPFALQRQQLQFHLFAEPQ